MAYHCRCERWGEPVDLNGLRRKAGAGDKGFWTPIVCNGAGRFLHTQGSRVNGAGAKLWITQRVQRGKEWWGGNQPDCLQCAGTHANLLERFWKVSEGFKQLLDSFRCTKACSERFWSVFGAFPEGVGRISVHQHTCGAFLERVGAILKNC